MGSFLLVDRLGIVVPLGLRRAGGRGAAQQPAGGARALTGRMRGRLRLALAVPGSPEVVCPRQFRAMAMTARAHKLRPAR